MKDMLELENIDMRKFISAVYELSVPQGLGFLHAEPGGLDKDTLDLFEKEYRYNANSGVACVLSIDYLRGRACKMSVWQENGKLYIHPRWFDHSPVQLAKLLEMSKA